MALFSSGSNAKGQLGCGDASDRHRFCRCSFTGCGEADDLPSDVASIIQIASGSNHTLLLVESADAPQGRHTRSVWLTGDGSRGQLGPNNCRGYQTFSKLDDVTLGNSALRGYAPVAVAALWETSFLVLRPPEWKHGASDAVIAMGANDFGDLGVPTTTATIQTQTPAASAVPPLGTPHTVSFARAIRSAQQQQQQQSQRRPQPTHGDAGLEEEYFFRVRRLEPGLHHVVAVLDVFRVGDDARSSSGSGSGSSNVRQCLVGWGASRHGQLHFRPVLEIESSASASTSVSITNSTGVVPRRQNGMQAIVPVPTHCEFPKQESITSLSLGQQHSVILSRETLFVAGSNKRGQLALDAGVVRGASSVHCTWNGTYVLCRPSDPDWQILATGSGDKGQLGVGAASGAPSSSPATTATVVSSSLSSAPQAQVGLRAVSFPLATGSKRIQSIACGSEHVLAVLASHEDESGVTEVWGWGWNEHGNLGLGHTHDVNVPVRIWPESEIAPPLGSVVNVWAGCGTSWLFVKGRSHD